MDDESRETTVVVEFVRAPSGLDGPARVTRRHGILGRTQIVDAAELDAVGLDAVVGPPGGDLKWLVKLVPALLVAMAPRH
ncbi:hypothetical protein [Cryptosporangium aurantiacum]|uniref:Uncharacterized protein n=1 Tax=Cryptosporangium aurantiacum TaxID=134849 RepID=A0A1M7JLP8_9ACTN|nr:hypothetical protein [Cryptosporangium aurantiacum]SHM53855.1 hypothetical protein SAMN05443668_101840 [Cryptosporangium aurantiacum]